VETYMTIFLPNKYTKIYYAIIDKARFRYTDEYTEKHHIIPECFYKKRRKGLPGWLEGDPNTSDNIVKLLAREHYICHLLLPRMVTGEAVYKMNTALTAMTNLISMYHNRYSKVNAKLIAKARESANYYKSVKMTGIRRTEQSKLNQSKAQLGQTHVKGKKWWNNGIIGTMCEQCPGDGWIPGRLPFTEDTKAKISKASKGRIQSQAEKDKRAARLKGIVRSEELKKRWSDSKKGKPGHPKSAETRQKMSNSQKKRYQQSKDTNR